MKRIASCLILLTGLIYNGQAQGKFFTRTGHTAFFSKALVEDIEAHNHQTSCIFDTGKGEVAFSIPIKGFEFRKALMQEHFNENYLESDKFPKATFKGSITNSNKIDWHGSESTTISVAGAITIHGVTKQIETQGDLKFVDERILISSTFPITVKDFNIKIPGTVINNIAKTVEVTLELALERYPNQ